MANPRVEVTEIEIHGRARFILIEDFVCTVNGVTYVVPAGTITDFMSVPIFARTWVSPVGRRARAALLHDHLLQTGTPYRTANNVFRAYLKELGMGVFERNVYWFAVTVSAKVKTALGIPVA